jgi:protein involved in polysaccharide export with SLBB domain
MKQLKTACHIFFLCVFALLMSGCYTRQTEEGCCCLTGRRPQVMATYSTMVNDSNPPFGCDRPDDVKDYDAQWDIYDCGEEFDFEEFRPDVIPVTPEMLDPFQKSSHNYRLAVGDELEITIFGDEESTNEKVIVAPDGRIYYGVLQGIPAAGLTVEALRLSMQSRVRHLYNDPIISIIPVVVTAMTYKILGRVKQCGVYYINNSVRLREAIAKAGGFKEQDQDQQDRSDTRLDEEVNLAKSFIIRDKKKIDVDFQALVKTADDDQNIFLQPDDYIYIAPMGVREVYVLGNILLPSRVNYYKGLTLMGALAYAGGWTVDNAYSADLTNVLLLRGELDHPWVSCINVMDVYQGFARDIYLCPGDIIYVSNKTMRFGRELVRLAIYTFVQAYMVGWASFVANEYIVPFPTIPVTPTGG